jgi:hypothetical protein
MEWNGMHAPLPPIPGYEDELSLRSAFPGLRSVKPIESREHFMAVARAAWKLYRHQYIPAPDIIAEEEAAAAKEAENRRVAEERRKAAEREAIAEGRVLAKKAYDALPDSHEALQDRLDVLNVSLEQFMVGFTETSTGTTTLFGDRPYRDCLVDSTNSPVVYKAVDSDTDETEMTPRPPSK